MFELKSKFEAKDEVIQIDTYEDHRMAMAFAPLRCVQAICIKNPEVVNKSYPSFWKHIDLVLKNRFSTLCKLISSYYC